MKYTIKGNTYTLISKKSAASSGPKYFGKYVFILKDSEGNYWRALGKTLAHNTRLIPTVWQSEEDIATINNESKDY